ncbi:MAG: helix-turn-helix domain-containing protein [Bifidobacteriaceae bacterium]|nr:helix-turn-helix domain-containing protein [Bifidobacteriaceae bacterium]
MPGNTTLQETRLLQQVEGCIAEAMPEGWRASIRRRTGPRRSAGGGAELAVRSHAGGTAVFEVILKASERSPAVIPARSTSNDKSAGVLYVTDYLPAVTREQLAFAGVSYADTTGWVRLVSDDPMLAIVATGASRAPKRDQRLVTARLNGPGTNRVMRTLLAASAPIGVRELADRAGVSPGTVSKLLPTLAAEGAVERGTSGGVVGVYRRAALERWTADYGFLRSNGEAAFYVAPRGVDDALRLLREHRDVAVSGSAAAHAYLPTGISPIVPVRQLAVYSRDPETVVSALALVPVDLPVANIIVVRPQDLGIVENPVVLGGIPLAPMELVLADLLSLPGRSAQEAEALMDALSKTDPQWRT